MTRLSAVLTGRGPVVVCLVAGLVLVSSAGVLGTISMNNANSQQTMVSVSLASQSRAAAAQLSREVDSVRLATIVAAKNPSIAQALSQGVHASPALLAAAGLQIQTLAAVRPGLISVARLRLASGMQIARILDAQTSMGGTAAPAAAGTDDSWVVAALQDGAGEAVTSAPHPAAGLGGEVVSTAVAVGPQLRPLGVLEVDTPVKALRATAAGALNWSQANLDYATFAAAAALYGINPVVNSSGIAAVGDNIVTWSTTSFDSRLPGAVALGWVVTVTAPRPPIGLAALSPLIFVLALVGLLLLLLSAVGTVSLGRRLRSARRDAVNATQRLEGRVAEMSAALARVADGDLGTVLPVDQLEDDTLRGLAHSFDSTRDRLRDLVEQAQLNGLQLSQASIELQAVAAQQASAANEQSAIVSETTATIEELAATAAQIAATSESVALAALETLRLTEQGRTSVLSSVDAMNAVAERVGAISERAVGLGETGREIGRILDVIDDLSERTNLLALNAAIEAARAGEHGQGFAVVAAEIRRLAERARASGSSIHELVDRISTESGATVQASREGQQEVDRARLVAHEAAESLDLIARMVDGTTIATREISIATQQQRSASDQVVMAMAQVAGASAQYAVGSRQAAASAAELAELSDVIRTSMGAFSTTQRSEPPAVSYQAPAAEIAVEDLEHEDAELVSTG
jgi:methyl-accepting chemotaxis protein